MSDDNTTPTPEKVPTPLTDAATFQVNLGDGEWIDVVNTATSSALETQLAETQRERDVSSGALKLACKTLEEREQRLAVFERPAEEAEVQAALDWNLPFDEWCKLSDDRKSATGILGSDDEEMTKTSARILARAYRQQAAWRAGLEVSELNRDTHCSSGWAGDESYSIHQITLVPANPPNEVVRVLIDRAAKPMQSHWKCENCQRSGQISAGVGCYGGKCKIVYTAAPQPSGEVQQQKPVCQECNGTGIMRNVGCDNDEIINDCPSCSEQQKEGRANHERLR